PHRPPNSPAFPYTTLFRSCGDKPAVGQTNDRIQADWIGRNRTSNPGQRRRLGPGVQFENFDRFPAAMMNDVERMDRVLSRAQIRSEEHTSELQSPDHLVCR